MTDRKLKRLLAEKPFLIDDNFSMTGGEAELMLMENSPLSIEDMLVKVRQKDGWKPEFEQMINRILANTPIARFTTRCLKPRTRSCIFSMSITVTVWESATVSWSTTVSTVCRTSPRISAARIPPKGTLSQKVSKCSI